MMDREIKRKILHTAAALAAVPFLLFLDLVWGWIIAGIGLATITVVWHLEQRGQELRGPAGQGQQVLAKTMENTMRPEERFPWAPFYFVGGLVVVATASHFLGIPLSIVFAAYAVLGIGDAASALIGKAYGSLEIPWNPEKSWEGTGAGLGSAYPWALFLASIYYVWEGTTFPAHFYWIILAGSIVGMFVETLPGEDNLTIPVASWGTMSALLWATGLL